jgi:hypothetical protein
MQIFAFFRGWQALPILSNQQDSINGGDLTPDGVD